MSNENLTQKDLTILDWHHSKDLINGSNKEIQAGKFLEEFIEYIAGCNDGLSSSQIFAKIIVMVNDVHHAGRIKTVPIGRGKEARQDAIGDMHIVAVNLAAHDNLTVTECVNSAFDIVSKRSGKKVNGVFVKSEDL
ncbi:MAG: hypothetical protein COA43_14635 [Robiginitomaculum sp.]|nr:MAG: hypothetical protein COA43_14635 [Robiginitomaculum sp.]